MYVFAQTKLNMVSLLNMETRCSSSPYACIMCMHADYACMHEYMHACVICMHAYHACTHSMHVYKLCMHAYDACMHSMHAWILCICMQTEPHLGYVLRGNEADRLKLGLKKNMIALCFIDFY